MASTTSPVQLARLVCIDYNNITNFLVTSGEKALLEFARDHGWLEYSVIAGTIPPPPSSAALTAPPGDSGACDDRPTSTAADRVERETEPMTTPPAKENVPATTISTATATTVASTTQARTSSPVTSANTAQGRLSTAAARPATAQVRTASVATPDATVQALTVHPVALASTAQASSVILSDTAEENTMALPLHLDTAEGHAAVEEEEKGEEPEIDVVAEFNMHDSNEFISALSKCEWSQNADADDPNLCDSDSESNKSDDIDTEDYIHEVMDTEEDLANNADEDALSDNDDGLDDAEFFEDVADDDWSPRENANANPDFLGDAELKAVSSAWVVYDQDHSGDLQVDGASDLYNGRWGLRERMRSHLSPCFSTSCQS
ncbi:hypothetical protein DVH05_004543 [Phytophthora capsici]|nr:hypothetical protein DVH05_004543 [Phytophthora capsici]